jgi:hypothetical protein
VRTTIAVGEQSELVSESSGDALYAGYVVNATLGNYLHGVTVMKDGVTVRFTAVEWNAILSQLAVAFAETGQYIGGRGRDDA